MQHVSRKMAGLALVVGLVLVGGVQAQQPQEQEHQQHHPAGAQAPQQQPAETGAGAPAQPQQMQGMMGRQGMGMSAQEEEDDAEASTPRGLMGMGSMMHPGAMMGRQMERLAQQLELTDPQRAQVRALLRTHTKEAMRLGADIGMLGVDVQQLLDTDLVDLPKVKQLIQNMAMKEADLRLAHIALMQEIHKLLTPEQQRTFRTMREHMMEMGGMMAHGGMMSPGGTMGRGRGEK